MLSCGCPENFPDWHGVDIDLGGQRVHSLSLPMLLHMPLAYELYRNKQQQDLARLGVGEPWPGFTLMRGGLWRGRLLRLVDDTPSPARHLEYLPRPFQIHGYLHQGGIGTIKEPVRTMQLGLLERGRVPKELYLCHLTCPSCSAQRGGDKIYLIRRWAPSAVLKKRVSAGA